MERNSCPKKKISSSLQLNETFIENILSLIHEESMTQQNDVMNSPNISSKSDL